MTKFVRQLEYRLGDDVLEVVQYDHDPQAEGDMAERVEHPDSEDIEERQRRERAEFWANLEEKLSDETIERLELMDELRESGELGEMIDSSDFSDLPAEFRPDSK